ncbi:MAG: SDR family oxidoreductase [Candidatus Dojkabacteria bacterium]|nr:MAG: SDR family oxidoreductase [Candidatus Dojkabacteria bacterium]
MSNNKRVLITGGTGFIGSHISLQLQEQGYKVARLDIAGECEYLGDASNKEFITSVIEDFKPNVVLHCAARKNLPDCEENKLETFQSNVLSTEYIVELSKKIPFKLIYISSDVVFDGKKGNYHIKDNVNPINWYGKTKVFSEAIIQGASDYAICRTALVIGKLNQEYSDLLEQEIESKVLVNQTLLPQYIYHRLKNEKVINLPTEYISNPTPIELLGQYILNIIKKDAIGIFHTSGVDAVSRYDIAHLIAQAFSFNNDLIHIDNTVVSILRPKNISMEVNETMSILDINPEDWRLNKYLNKELLYE